MSVSSAQLNVYANQQLIQELPLEKTPTTLGKAADNTLVLTDGEIAPHHAQISWDGNHYQVIDVGSQTGTWLNEQQIPLHTPHNLQSADFIRIGNLELQFLQEIDSPLPGTVMMELPDAQVLQVATPSWVQEFILKHDRISIGRDTSCDIVIDLPFMLPRHAELVRRDHRYELLSLVDNTNLVFQGQPITHKTLADGDIIQIGLDLTLTYQVVQAATAAQPTPQVLNLRNRTSLRLGRDPRNDTVIDHPTVSRFHARIELRGGSWTITDLESSNSTFVNGLPIASDRGLKPGDTIRIGPCELLFNIDETLVQQNEAGNLRIDAVNLCKATRNGVVLLDNVSLSILPREFVAIVGVSGAGKSTLLDALNGLRPATDGMVLVNNHDLYKNFSAYRSEVGYVPQEDIIHRELTVFQALNYAARLRLPADTTPAERHQRIQTVLTELELSHRQQVAVKQLSGGQRKRVSMGVELLTEPSLFFLDEATSGLDPGTEVQMMRLLRKLADQGRTILLITHATKNVMMCNMVVFLAKGGRVAYFGPPEQALTYFEVSDFDEIYLRVEGELTPEEWQRRYHESTHYQRYVVERQRPITVERPLRKQDRLALPLHDRPTLQPPTQAKGISAWRQFTILSQRQLAILGQEQASLVLMLSLAPVLGLLDWIMWQRSLFDPTIGDPGQAFTMVFVSVLIATIVGSLGTMREIVKETDIYRRERMVGLKILPYLFSKVWIAALLAVYQAAIFLLTKELAVDIPGGWETTIALYITLLLATLGGMVMGLLVSALSSNQNIAPLLTIFFLVPQITFAGAILPLRDMGLVGQFLSSLTVTRWTYEAMVTQTKVGRDIAIDPCWQQSEAERKVLTEVAKKQCLCLGANIFKTCNFPGIREQYKPAVDQPEPAKPKEPGDLPAAPDNPLDPAYRDDIDAYGDRVKAYQTAINAWQKRFSTWKEDRGTAIASAEAIINRFQQSQGGAFNVNVIQHWSKLGILILGMFGLLVVAQKRKDTI